MTCDFCGREIHDNNYDNDGETIMCQSCQESGQFGHYQPKEDKMTLEQLQKIRETFLQAIKDYRQSKDYDEIKLECLIDNTLTRLPRDLIYVEWFDRSDISNMADGVFDEPADEDTIDKCMTSLDRFNGSIMEYDAVEQIVVDTIIESKKKGEDENSL